MTAVARRVKIGDIAGCLDSKGYLAIAINGNHYRLHRLAFLYMEGKFPPSQVDHINRVKHDNRWVNIRHATASENMANLGKFSNNTSGYKGVYWVETRNRWLVKISHGKKVHHVGYFECKHDAAKAYNTESMKHHGEFAFVNIVQ